MKRVPLMISLSLGALCLLGSLATNYRSTALGARLYNSSQSQQPLTLDKIEALIDNKVPDAALAITIREMGIAFKLETETLESLRKRGAGPQTLQALSLLAERAAYEAYRGEPDLAKKLALGKEFRRQYPQSNYAKEVEAGNLKALNEIFASALRAFSQSANATPL